MDAYEHLLEQIDQFIRKYYKNQLIKGSILLVSFFLFSFLFISGLEYFIRFNSTVRAFLFFSFLLINGYILIRYFLIPFAKIYSFGKRISRYQASEIIGVFFPTISDRVLNTLQLHDNLSQQQGNIELIQASINQRSEQLSVIPFSKGIDFKQNLRFVKYALPVFFIFLLTLLFFPNLIKQGSNRLVNYSETFVEKAPFDFILKSKLIYLEEGSDFDVLLKTVGNSIPDKVYLVSNEGKFLMEKDSKVSFSYSLVKLMKSTSFYFEANGFQSQTYVIKVIPKSTLGKFEATLFFPAYLDRKPELVKNAGDLTIPEGTRVEWNVFASNSENTKFVFPSESKIFSNEGFKFSKTFNTTSSLAIVLNNRFSSKSDTNLYKIDVIKDAFPSIVVQEEIDSISTAIRYFTGNAKDDYGLSSVYFVYSIQSKNGNKKEFKVRIPFVQGSESNFSHAVDFRRENIQLEDKIEYYFVVYDNDGVNGSKASRSQLYTYSLPSLEELNDLRDEKTENIKEDLNTLLNRTKDFKKDINRLKKDVLNSKSSDWNKKNQLNQIQEEQKSLQQSLDKLKQQMNESLDEKNKLSELDKELLEKQELLEKLLDEIMDQELLDLLNELEKLMEKDNKFEVQDKLDKLDTKAEDMNKQLDRSLEMLKKMQVNEKLDDLQKELDKLASDQLKLKEDDKLSNEEKTSEQDKIQKKFEDLMKELDAIKSLNDALEKPMNLGDQNSEEQQANEELDQAKENLSKGKANKAKPNQNAAAEKMKEISKQLETLQQEANKKENEEDMNLIRNILESLMNLSFSQEDVMNRFSKVKDTDPFYTKLGRRQRKIVDDTKIVADSLNALAKRNPKIARFIDQELNTIQASFNTGLEDIDEHRRSSLGVNLQYVMTSYNNLALLLNESLQQMQSQMQSQMEGSGSCDKPGGKGKKPSSGSEGDMKEMLKKQLEQMKKGSNPGGNSPGNKQGEGNQGMPGLGNKQIAKMAAEQTAIRQRLEQLRNDLNKGGKGQGNQLNPLINELEKQEKDLINKRFSPEMITRQQEILTRLLESEKAIQERGFDEKRESKSGKDLKYSNQKRIDEYNQQKRKQIELLRSVDPLYRKYYKDKANAYFNRDI